MVATPLSASIDPVRRPWQLGASLLSLFGRARAGVGDERASTAW
jgi:hypothetical protein